MIVSEMNLTGAFYINLQFREPCPLAHHCHLDVNCQTRSLPAGPTWDANATGVRSTTRTAPNPV